MTPCGNVYANVLQELKIHAAAEMDAVLRRPEERLSAP
jgi:hypothetical protein